MLRMFLRKLIILTLGLLAVGASLTPAAAQPSSVNAALGQQATLVARGVAVDVPVIYTCSPDFAFGFIYLSASEGVPRGRVALGSGSSSDVTCDDSQHTTFVRVVSYNAIAFHVGTALVQGYLTVCRIYYECTTVTLSAAIRVARK